MKYWRRQQSHFGAEFGHSSKPSPNMSAGFSQIIIFIVIAVLVLIGGMLAVKVRLDSQVTNLILQPSDNFGVQSIPLEGLADPTNLGLASFQSLSINGQLRANNSLIITPTSRPTQGTLGQIYYDKEGNAFAYYDGTEFVDFANANDITGLQQQLGNVQSGLAAIPNISLPDDIVTRSSDNIFTGSNSFTGSLDGIDLTLTGTALLQGSLTVDGAAALSDVTASNLAVGGTTTLGPTTASSLVLSSPLAVGSGGTGASSFTTNSILIGQGSGPITSVSAGSTGLCLISTAGAPAFQACPGGAGTVVDSLNGLTGPLSIANSSGSGSVITIDNASAAAKGIASFNATNFNVSAGAVNTIQDIAVTSSPVFNALTLTTPLAVTSGGTGTNSLPNDGVLIGQGTSGVTGVTAGGSGLCLISTAGAPSFQVCPGSGGVASVNGLTGALTVSDATAAGSTITINDATTTTKGIASFNSGNFVVTSGGVSIKLGGVTGAELADGTVSNVDLQNSSLTVTAGNGLLNGGAISLGGAATLNIGAGDGVSVTADAIAVDATVCRTTGNCVGVGGSGDILQGGNSFAATMTIGTNDAQSLVLETSNTPRLTITSAGAATFSDSVAASSFAGDGSALTTLNASNLASGTVASGRITGSYTGITGVGTVTAGTWQGGAIADAYLQDNITVSATGSVDWTALNNYPAACAAGSAITALGDTVTCGAFASASGSGSYIQNGTANQNTANFNIQSAAVGSVTAKLRALASQTADVIQVRDSTDATMLFSVSPTGAVSGTSFAGDGANLTNLNASNIATGTLNVARIADGSLTNAKLTNSSLTITAGNGLTNGGSIALGSAASLNIGAGDGISVTADAVAVDATVCRTSGNCVGVGGSGDILQGGNSFATTMTIGTNDAQSLVLETSNTPRLTITSAGTATFSSSVAAISFSGDGSALTSLNATNLTSGTVNTARIAGSYTGITGVGTVTAGTWQGGAIADAYLQDNITVGATGTVDWTALNNYPAACAAGSAVTALGDTVTCSAFASASGSGNYIQNTTADQNTANFNIQTAAVGSVTAKLRALASQTADIIQIRNAADTVTVFAISPTGAVTGASFAGDGAGLTNLNGSSIASGTVANARLTGSGALTITAGNGLLNGGSVALGAGTTLNIGAGDGISVAADSVAVDSTVCRTSGNCVGVGGSGDILQGGNSFGVAMTIGTNDTQDLNLETNDVTRLTITSAGAATFTGSVAATSFSGDGSALTNLNASNLASGTVASARISGSYTGITGVGTITAGTWQGGTIADAYLQDNITISSAGAVDWAALNNYPAACAAGSAITTLGDTPTCTAFAAASGSGSYIQNGTGNQNTANFNIQSAAVGSVTAKLRVLASQTADIIQVRDSTDVSTLFSISPTGAVTSSSTVQGTQLISTVATGTAPLQVTSTTAVTNLNADLLDGQHGSFYQNATNLNAGTVASARIAGSYTGITGVGTITAGTWQGAAVADTYVADNITISSTGTVDWTALNNYPAACAAGSAVTALGDTPTCTAFAAASGSGSYIQNGTANQNTANFNIQSSAVGSVTAKLRVLASQTADVIQVRDSTDTSTLFSVSPSGAVTGTSFAGDGANLTNLNASNIATGTLNTARVAGSYTGITGVGTITVGTWQGTAVADTYVADNITISSAGTVDWAALNNYPAACAAGSAITALGDSVTCQAFAAASGSGNYIQNTTANQNSANLNIQSSAVGSVTAKLRVLGSQTADVIQVRDSTDTSTLFSVSTTGGVTGASFTGNGSALTNLNGSNIATGTVANARLAGSGALTVTAGNGLLNGGSVALGASTTLNIGAGDGITVNADDIAVDATVCRTTGNCVGVGGSGDILQGGNSFATAMTIGTNDVQDLNLETAGVARLTITSAGAASFSGALAVTGALTGSSTLQGTQLISTVATGTAPLQVASTTAVTNLNADLLDGQHGGFYQNATNLNAGTVNTARVAGSYTGITGTGALSVGSIASGFGTISTGNTITGTTLNGTTGINTGAGVGTQRLDASGNLVNIGNITASGSIASSKNNVTTYQNVYSWGTTAATQTGTLQITLPNAWNSTMLRFTIVGYDYSSNAAWRATIGGYNYGVGSTWINTSAEIEGNAPFNSVRLAYDSVLGKTILLLGNTSTVWNIPQFSITEVVAGFTNQNTWGSGYSSSFITSEADVTTVVTPTVRQTAYTNQVALQGGNSFGATATFGTNDAQSLVLETANTPRLTITSAGAASFSGTLGITGAVTGSSTIQGTQLISTVATGTAPLTVASTTLVSNLNADLLDGNSSAFFQDAANINAGTLAVARGGTGNSSYAIGDLLYASGATTLSKLAAVASGSCLVSQGVGTAPGWGSCGLSAEADTLATVTGRGATTSTNTTFNGTLTTTSDVTHALAGTENLAVTSDLAGVTNVFAITGTPSATAGTTRGINIDQANSANTNGLDFGLRINNLDTDLPMTAAIQIADTGGGGYTNVITAPSFTLNGAGAITAGTWQGAAVADTYVADNITISSTGTVDWTALNNYPAACAAGSAITALGDTQTCTAFAPASGSSNYVQLQGATPGTAQTGHLNITGTAIASTFSGSGASLTSLNATNLASGTVASARVAGSYTGITGTGALDAGSITSNFGAINNGASGITTTGTLTGGTLSVTNNATVGGTLTVTGNATFDTNTLFVDAANNRVGIGTTAPNTALDVNGTISRAQNNTRTYKNAYTYNITGATQTGTIVLTAPKGFTNTMLRFTIKGYDYTNSTGAWEAVIGGYAFATTPAWVNTSAEIRGNAPFSSVRLGYDGTNVVIMLGTTTTVWQYPKVVIEEIVAGHSSVDDWGGTWSGALVTDETTPITYANIVTPPVRSPFIQGGNTFGATATLGTNDAQSLVLETANVARLTITSAGAASFSGTLGVTGAVTGSSTIQGTQLISTVATGTAPLTVASTTLVSNFNADLLDGNSSAFFQDATNVNAGTLAVARGGTGIASYAIGDLLYASGATTLSKLAAVASGSCLTSQGVGAAPAWGSCGLSAEADTLATVTARGASTSTNTTFNGTLAVNSDTTFSFAGTENLVVNSDLSGAVNMMQLTGTPSATAGTTRGFFLQQANSLNTNGLDTGIYINNADTDLAITTAIQINDTGGGGYTNLIDTPTFDVSGAGALTASSTIQGTRFISTVATGTAPLTVTSTTLVTNLNADLLDGQHASAFAAASGSGSYIQNGTSPQTADFNITGNGTIGGTLTVTGAATFNGSLAVSSVSNVAYTRGTSITTTGTINNMCVGPGNFFKFTGASAVTLTGLTGASGCGTHGAGGSGSTGAPDGRTITFVNGTGVNMTIRTDSASSSVGNRIFTGTGGTDLVIRNGGTFQVIYDTHSSAWRTLGDGADTDCSNCATRALDNLSSVAINAGLKTTSGDLLLDPATGVIRSVAGTSLEIRAGATGSQELHLHGTQVIADNNGVNTAPGFSFNTHKSAGMFINNTDQIALAQGGSIRFESGAGLDTGIWISGTQRGQRLCHNGGDAPAAGLRMIGDCTTGGSDFAEYYGSPGNVPVASIVQYDAAKPLEHITYTPTGETPQYGNKAYVATATDRSKAIGVYSTNPYVDVLGKEYYAPQDNIIPIGLAGRVPVRVNTSGGAINVGDPIMLSSTPGVGTKATTAGMIIGYAMEAFHGSGEGKAVVLISTSYWAPEADGMLQAQAANFGELQVSGAANLGSLNVSGATTLATLEVTGDANVQGKLTVEGDTEVHSILVNGHIVTSGNAPTVTLGVAAGQAGEGEPNPATTVDGNDSAGTVSVTTGTQNTTNGVLAHISFAQAFNGSYKVVLSASNDRAGLLRVHVIKTSTGFDIVANDPATATTQYAFDYIVLGTKSSP